MKKLIVLGFLLVLTGCMTTKNDVETNTTKQEQYEKIVSEKEVVLLDVRTKEEYDESHLLNSINIPYDEIDEETELDKNKVIVVYCRSGRRSNIAKETLVDLGYEVLDLGAFDDITYIEKE